MHHTFWVSPDLTRAHKATDADEGFAGYLVKADNRKRATLYARWYRRGVYAAIQMATAGDLSVIKARVGGRDVTSDG